MYLVLAHQKSSIVSHFQVCLPIELFLLHLNHFDLVYSKLSINNLYYDLWHLSSDFVFTYFFVTVTSKKKKELWMSMHTHKNCFYLVFTDCWRNMMEAEILKGKTWGQLEKGPQYYTWICLQTWGSHSLKSSNTH